MENLCVWKQINYVDTTTNNIGVDRIYGYILCIYSYVCILATFDGSCSVVWEAAGITTLNFSFKIFG